MCAKHQFMMQDLADFALDELAPANVNYIHKLWLREVEKRRHASQAQLEKQQTEEAKKAESVSHFNAKLRSTILAGSDSSGKAGSRGCVSTKPAWALTEKEVVHAADAEEEELLAFADSLDFDRFMSTLDELELKDTLQALEEVEETNKGDDKAWRSSFVRAMRHVSRTRAAQASHPAAREADDCQSVAGMSEARSAISCRSGRPGSCKVDGGDGGWDASTKAGSDGVAVMEAVKSMHEADSFLRENPDLKATHSHASCIKAVDAVTPVHCHVCLLLHFCLSNVLHAMSALAWCAVSFILLYI
ncbi:hypothetical protein QJQ45_016082 [Haematococcus lacustris]|nr:hypothetical protein QJQ45_016082 [Haematococcus lacustris]